MGKLSATHTFRFQSTLQAILLEGGWLLVAAAISLVVVAYTANTAGRGEMMLLDGDSMIIPLLARSLTEGGASDWAMSAAFFVPETFLYLMSSAIPGGVAEHQVLAGVLNLVCLYGVLRLVARWVMNHRGLRVFGTFLVFLTFILLILAEGTGDRNSLELASLLTMTTYYSGTVLAALVAVASVQRLVEWPDKRAAPLVVLAFVSVLSTFSNPIYLAWVALPLIVVLLFVSWRTRASQGVIATGVLVIACVVGYLLRLPLGRWMVADQQNYFQTSRVVESLAYYQRLLVERLDSPGGGVSVLLIGALVLVALVQSAGAIRRRELRSVIVSIYAWFAPVAATSGFILLGTEAARYLQPWTFAPALSVFLIADRTQAAAVITAFSRTRAAMVARASVVLVAVTMGGLGAPSAMHAAAKANESVACAVDWVNSNPDRVGAGQFWSVRAVKAHLNTPSQLIQVDYRMNGYSWLVGRTDFNQKNVSFVVTDSQSYPFEFPPLPKASSTTTIGCGRFQILDFGTTSIPIGPTWP